MKKFGLTETKLFYIHRISKIRGRERGSSEPPEPPLDPPLIRLLLKEQSNREVLIIRYVALIELSPTNSIRICKIYN